MQFLHLHNWESLSIVMSREFMPAGLEMVKGIKMDRLLDVSIHFDRMRGMPCTVKSLQRTSADEIVA